MPALRERGRDGDVDVDGCIVCLFPSGKIRYTTPFVYLACGLVAVIIIESDG
jgi:hypothetical protein